MPREKTRGRGKRSKRLLYDKILAEIRRSCIPGGHIWTSYKRRMEVPVMRGGAVTWRGKRTSGLREYDKSETASEDTRQSELTQTKTSDRKHALAA